MMRSLIPILAALSLLASGCAEEAPPDGAGMPPSGDTSQRPVDDLRGPAASDREAPRAIVEATAAAPAKAEIEWDALIPDDYRPDKLMEGFDLEEFSDDDPRAEELMAKLQALWDEAPVREDLDGQAVKLPGFVVPVEADAEETTGFLLVPYYGACIHVPPPPANQTVYVITEAGKGAAPGLFDVVWVSGTMSVKRIENDIAEAGYTLYATQIEPYE